jgi:hypothetical protein
MATDSWSKRYYDGLADWQHDINDAWFWRVLALLSDTGILAVPSIGKVFDKHGEEVEP